MGVSLFKSKSLRIGERIMTILGKDGQKYTTVEACVEAYKKFDEWQAERELKESIEKNRLSKQKKEKADAIEAATKNVDIARAEYDKAREEAQSLIKEAREKGNKLLSEAGKKYRDAMNARYEALNAFNKEFGAYTTTYTGKEALDEYNRWTSIFNKMVSSMFDWAL